MRSGRRTGDALANARCWHETDMAGRLDDVRCQAQTGNGAWRPSGPVLTRNGRGDLPENLVGVGENKAAGLRL